MRHATLALLAVCSAFPAQAFQPEYPEQFFDHPVAQRKPQVRAWVHRPTPPPKITRNVVGTVEAKPKGDPRCKPWISAIGDSAKSEAAAKLEAQKSWKGVVQFEMGNKYLDLANAEDLEFQCGPSSVPRFGGLVESAASKFLPIESMTCKLSARPCTAPIQRDVGK